MAPRDDSGQATIEHLGLVALVAIVLLAAGAIAAVAGPGLSNRVTTAMQRALCTVVGQQCPTLEQEPCPLLRTDRTLATRISVGWLRLGNDRALAIERRSDGTYEINLIEGIGAGAGATLTRSGFEGAADALLSGRAGRTWSAPNRRAAEQLVARLRKRALPGAESLVRGAADLAGLAGAEDGVDAYVVSGRAAVSAAAQLGLGGILEGGADTAATAELGLRIAAHRKEVTAYVALDGRVGAFFDALPAASLPRSSPRGRGPGRGKGSGTSRDRTPDDRGEEDDELGSVLNPDKLHADVERTVGGTVALRLAPGPRVLAVDITATVGSGDARRELHARLDPHDPAVAQALRAWRRRPADAQALTALGQAAAASAAVDERRFVLESSEKDYGGAVGAGPGLGLTVTKGLQTATLVEQRSRPVGGVWERRLDCEVA
jgi:Flp pilus assembly pilin Flp